MIEAVDHAASEGLLSGLQQTGQAAAILDKAGRVISMNARGAQHMGHTLLVRDGRLSASSQDADDRLQRLIKCLIGQNSAAGRERIELAVLPEPEGHSLVVRGTPVASEGSDLFFRARALVTFTQVGKTAVPRATILRDVFGLTATEASIATAIANGEDPRAIAARKGVSVETVRSQLKSIFAKTNTRRQVSLAVLITKIQDIMA